jgi:formylglycine-generating enzyme required for sulfatase activity
MRDKTPENIEDVHVRLKPLFGIAPTTYVPVIYGILILAVVFLLLLLPGILNPGTRYTIISTPSHAAISVDGAMISATPDEVFVAEGMREIVISRPGFESSRQTLDVGGRLFGSLFVPRRETLRVNLVPGDLSGMISSAAAEFATWSLLGEASGQRQFPPLARELARNLAASGNADDYAAFAQGALRHIDSEAQLADLLSGAFMSRGGAVSPASLASVLQEAAAVTVSTPGLAVQLDAFLTGARDGIIADSAWAEAARRAYAGSVDAQPPVLPATAAGATRDYDGVRFIRVPPGSGRVGGSSRAENGGDLPMSVDLPSLLVSQTEVTVADYARFVAARPEWALSSRDQLVRDGLVDDDYLRDWEAGTPGETLPVRYVSAHAAAAYASWFSERIAASGLTARLPTEAEWTYAAALDSPFTGVFAELDREGPEPVAQSGRGNLGAYGMLGNVWEWTTAPFARYERLYPDGAPLDSDLRVVLGGGWATPPADFTADDRGAMPADWCSPAVGFRLILAE